jgi:hypothetical protein
MHGDRTTESPALGRRMAKEAMTVYEDVTVELIEFGFEKISVASATPSLAHGD